ncbi:MAG: hypothetical protein R6V59_07365 [Dehalococcoidia bacterium]
MLQLYAMDVPPVEILKWVGIVLAGGFIGYFGRYLAMLIIEKRRRKQTEQAPEAAVKDPIGNKNDLHEEAAVKLEKKRAKAESKRLKKQDKGAKS